MNTQNGDQQPGPPRLSAFVTPSLRDGEGEPIPVTPFRLRKPIIQWQEFGQMTAHLFRERRNVTAIWIHNRMDPAFREEIMLAVAGANACRQCSYAHREWALAQGVLESELIALEGLDADHFDSRVWAAVAWVQDSARSDFAGVPAAIDANFRQWYDDQERDDIELTARMMCWMNRVSNTVDAGIDRLRRKPVPGSGLGRETFAIVVYALVVPGLLIYLAIRQKRRPMELFRGVVPFFQDFAVRQLQVAQTAVANIGT